MENDDTLAVLRSIDRRLALLTATQERKMKQAVDKDLLRSDGRIKMFDAIDGRRTSKEIADVAGVSERAVQLFVKELLDSGLVREAGTGSGRSVIVEQDSEALVRWYVAWETGQRDRIKLTTVCSRVYPVGRQR